MTSGETPGRESNPRVQEETQARRPPDSITDFGAVAFLFGLFFLALGLMYLIGLGRG